MDTGLCRGGSLAFSVITGARMVAKESDCWQQGFINQQCGLRTIGFDLVIDGTMFQVLWEQAKRKNTFTWESKNTRHDPFAVHAFGANIDKVVAPTTREHGTKAAMELGVMSRD